MLRKTEIAENPADGMSGAASLIRSKAVVSRVMAGETLIIPIRGHVGDLASIYSFNPTGSLIWKMLEEKTSIPQLVDGVAHEYGMETAHVEGDVRKFVDEMISAGLVEAAL